MTNYLKIYEDGTTEATKVKPSFGMYEKESANDNRDVYIGGKWYSTTGGELVINGTFDSPLGGEWSAVSSTISIEGNKLKLVSAGATYGTAELTFNGLTIGETYNISFDLIKGLAGANVALVRLYNNSSEPIYDTGWIGASDNVSFEFIANGTEGVLIFVNDGTSNGYNYWDNISVFKTEPTIGTEYTDQFTYASKNGKLLEVEVANGVPVDLHYNEDAPKIVENVAKFDKVIQTGNRKIIELGTIFKNNRYVIDNPFGNENYEDCDVKVEVFDGIWSESGYVYIAGQGSLGTVGFSNLEGVVIQTGNAAISGIAVENGGGHGNITFGLASAPARVIVTYQGDAK